MVGLGAALLLGGCATAGDVVSPAGGPEVTRRDRALASVALLAAAAREDAPRRLAAAPPPPPPAREEDPPRASLAQALAPLDRLADSLRLQLWPLPDGRVVPSVGLVLACEAREDLLALIALARAHRDLGHVRASLARAVGDERLAEAEAALGDLIAAAAAEDDQGEPAADPLGRLAPARLGALAACGRAALAPRFTAEEQRAARDRALVTLEHAGVRPGALASALRAVASVAEREPERARPFVEAFLLGQGGAGEESEDAAASELLGDPVLAARYQETLEPLRERAATLLALGAARARLAAGQAGALAEEIPPRATLALDPRHALLRAAACAQQGRRDAGLLHLRQATVLDPQWALARTALGRALLDRGEAELALTHLDRAVALAPFDPEGRLLRARTLRALGRAAEARREAARAEAVALPDGAIAEEARGIAGAGQGIGGEQSEVPDRDGDREVPDRGAPEQGGAGER